MSAAPTVATETAAGTSLYVHVPFCVVKCGYCDFTSYTVEDRGTVDRWLDGLARELDLVSVPPRPATVFVGGGTPTYLDHRQLERLFRILADHADLRGCPEVTMEANPESVDRDKIAIARSSGVGRVSLGAQSFAADRLRFLDRAHDADRTRWAVAEVRQAGIDNFSLDLIFGLPGQSLADWEDDLRQALDLQPAHLSCYNLTYEPGTRLHRDLRRGRLQPNPDDLDRAMFERTGELLADAGFARYEVSNFAGRGGPCLHNDRYWLQGDYAGVGPGAASHRAGFRSTNLKPLPAWFESVDRGIPPTAEAECLGRRQRAAEALWLGVRRTDGIDLDAVGRRLAAPVAAWAAPVLERLRPTGWLQRTGSRIRLTGAGLLFADSVAEQLLAL